MFKKTHPSPEIDAAIVESIAKLIQPQPNTIDMGGEAALAESARIAARALRAGLEEFKRPVAPGNAPTAGHVFLPEQDHE